MEKEERGRILTDVADNLGVSESEALSQFREQARNRQREKEPLVCCVTLTKDRPQMLQRAIACFRAQSYARKALLIWDTGTLGEDYGDENIIHAIPDSQGESSTGKLRNAAADFIADAEVIVHFDDDDWSHPERIAEQVALLQVSGKECVGYREMLFWREGEWRFKPHETYCVPVPDDPPYQPGEAWLYLNGNPRYCLGTSLCYWRSVWKHRPFEDKQWGEDTAWLLGVDSLGTVSLTGTRVQATNPLRWVYGVEPEPRMIASIHGGNTSPAYRAELMRASEKQGGEWRRAPQWDDYCRRTMEAGCLSKSSRES